MHKYADADADFLQTRRIGCASWLLGQMHTNGLRRHKVVSNHLYRIDPHIMDRQRQFISMSLLIVCFFAKESVGKGKLFRVLGTSEVSANLYCNSRTSVLGRLRDYLRILMGHLVYWSDAGVKKLGCVSKISNIITDIELGLRNPNIYTNIYWPKL